MKNKNWKKHYKCFRRSVILRKAEKRWNREFGKSSKRRKIRKKSQNYEEKEIAKLRRLFPGYDFVKAPVVFSLINNEVETLKFIRRIKCFYEERKRVCVRLDKVESISTDAILVLLSNMVQFRLSGIEFNGTKPVDDKVRVKLENSGFFDHLYGKDLAEHDAFTFKELDSHIFTHGQKTVASGMADDIMKYTSEFIWGEPRRCQGGQKTLVELMHNTYDHAASEKGLNHWWLSVEKDEIKHEVTYSFIDFGVGIFRSLKNKVPGEPLFGALKRLLSSYPSAEKEHEQLKLILEGKIKVSQDRKYYRGKGLAKIYHLNNINKISSLSIISNHASMNADRNEFHALDDEFMGTFISFKINEETLSLPWEI